MKISNFAVRRPVSITIIISIILMMGFFTLSKLGVDLYPDMKLPIAAVITSYPGAGPEEVETQISQPLESMLNSIGNLEQIESRSTAGSSFVILSFTWGTDMNDIMVDVRDRIGLAERVLPKEAEKPMVLKIDVNMMPILQVGITGDEKMSLAQIQAIAEDEIEPRLSRIPQVASVSITGGLVREVKVEVDPVKLQNYGLTLSQINSVLQAENFNSSSGKVTEGQREFYVRNLQQFESTDDIKNVAITTANGQNLVLGDVANIVDGFQDEMQLTRVNGNSAVGIFCQKQSDANTVEACDEVKKELDAITKELSDAGINLNFSIVFDQSTFINSSIQSTEHMMYEGAILAMLVLFLFLRNIRSTLIVFTAIPLSIISTFILMYLNNSTINVITLGGLALGIGRMVDDSIVVYENIYRHRMLGLGMKEASLMGASQVGQAVIASTLTLIAVFLPIMFTEGLASVLFKPLAITVSFAIFSSLIVSLTVIPFMSSRLLTDKAMGLNEYQRDPNSVNRVKKMVNRFGEWIDNLGESYKNLLQWSLGHRKTIAGLITVMMLGSLVLMYFVGAEFLPSMDSGEISISLSMDKGNLIDSTDKVAREIESRLHEVAEINTIFSSIGGSGNQFIDSAVHGDTATFAVKLSKSTERDRDVNIVAEDIRNRLAGIPGTKINVTVTDNMGGGASGSGEPINLQISGDDLHVLTELSDSIAAIVRSVPGTREVNSSLQDGSPEVRIRIDRQRASSYGLSPMQISNEIKNAMQGSVATRYKVGGEEIDLRVGYTATDYEDLEALQNLNIRTPQGALVELAQVATFEMAPGPVQIQRIDRVRRAVVTGYLLNRDLAAVTTDIKTELDKMNMPPGYTVEFAGAQQDMDESFGSLGIALLMAIILVYGVMAVQYESFFAPFVIMFSVPTALIGVVLALLITGKSFSVPSFIGLIMLVGIVVSNAIVFVDYLQQMREAGMERDEAIIETGRVRLRPILMTAFSTILAMIPLAIGIGEGSESTAPLAVVIIGGLTVSTFLTLVLVPVMYTMLDDFGNKFRSKKKLEKTEIKPSL